MNEQIETMDEPNLSEKVANSSEFIKHPLQDSWAMWYFRNVSANWADNIKIILAFDTIEDFWALYNHILPPSKLQQGCDYSMFKDGIKPMWEDDRNRRGGMWTVNIDKTQRQKSLDSLWRELLLSLIGDAFEGLGDLICGCVVNIRAKGDRLSLWTADASDSESNKRIGLKLKEIVKMAPDMHIQYESHGESTTRKIRYNV